MHKTVKQIESVLLPKLVPSNKQIVSCDVKHLTSPGENYGSILLSLDFTIKEINNEKKEILHCVAKTVPKNDFIQNFFMSTLTFKKELGLYDTVMPTLRQFQNEQGMENVIDFIADFYGGILSFNPSLIRADEDAVILMENLKVKGYESVDRKKGFDFETACSIIKDLAVFHAVPIALKIKQPKIFEENIMPSLEYAGVFEALTEEMKKQTIEDILKVAAENPKCHPYLASIKKKCENSYHILDRPRKGREPFATLTHNDLWVNNILIKFSNGKPVHNKIVDFQFTSYDTPAKDLIFLIFDSIQNDVIQNHYDKMIKLYHDHFLSTLLQLNVPTDEFSFDHFLKEIDFAAQSTFVIAQCFLMLRPIFAVKDAVQEVENLSPENILQYREPSQEHNNKMSLLVEEFVKREWL